MALLYEFGKRDERESAYVKDESLVTPKGNSCACLDKAAITIDTSKG